MGDKEVLDSKLNALKLGHKLRKLKSQTGFVVQSLLFPKDKFTVAEAKKWATSHKFSSDVVNETDNYVRIRQKAPKFKTYKTMHFGDEGVKAVVGCHHSSKFAAFLHVNDISKFSDIKNDLDIVLPMKAEIQILRDGKTRDGVIRREDLEASLDAWADIPIIDYHDMSDKYNPTDHKISDRKGYTTGSPRLEVIGEQEWIFVPVLITDRNIAYQLYLKQQLGKPLEVSAEFGHNKYTLNGETYLYNINPHLISIVERGHLEGNRITVTS